MVPLKRNHNVFLEIGWLSMAQFFVALACSLLLPQPSLAAPGTWSPTGPLANARAYHTATRLADGRVLVAGGWAYIGLGDPNNYPNSELFNPATGTWNATGTPLDPPRQEHAATLLPNGQVLVAGGYNVNLAPYSYLGNVDIFYPLSEIWTSTGQLTYPRSGPTATLLADGRVLVTGGYNEATGAPNTAELIDPAALPPWPWNFAPWCFGHTATRLADGRVLVVGGWESLALGLLKDHFAALYNPATGTWSDANGYPGTIVGIRAGHTATLLKDGRVLVAGGWGETGTLASAELYDPATGFWSVTGVMKKDRSGHTATLLADGRVLVVGGDSSTGTQDSAELYDPATGSWSLTGSLATARGDHTATLLFGGKVLVAGGRDKNGDELVSAEIYTPNVVKVKLPKSLLAFYPFDFGPQDVSGNGLHAQVTGSPQPLPGYLDQGQAYLFNGATDYLTAPLDINPNQYPKLTMGCWAKTASLLPWWQHQPVLTHDNDGFDRTIAIDWRGNGFDLEGNPNAVGWSAFGGAEGQVLGGEPAILDQWTFLAAVYDQTAGTVTFQVDDMVFTKTGATLGLGRDKLLIGFRPGTSSFLIDTFFAGAIDNVFVFGEALTDEQRAYIRSGGAQAIMTAARKIDPGILYLLLMD
jgi:hypothetical protein